MFLIDALKKIGVGAKFLAESVWGTLKAAFGAKAKDITLAALESAKQLLETEVGQFIQTVVLALEASPLDGAGRLASATTTIKDYLSQQGKQMSKTWIQWAIQTILLFIRGLAPAA